MQPKIKLHYVTYQTFPSKKANTLQTIGNLKYLSKNNVDSTLIFPLRKHESSSNENTQKNSTIMRLISRLRVHHINFRLVGHLNLKDFFFL